MTVSIQPLSYRAGTGISLGILNIYGNPPINVVWQIMTDTNHALETGEIQLSADEWANWPAGEDNNYIENIVAARLGVTIIPS